MMLFSLHMAFRKRSVSPFVSAAVMIDMQDSNMGGIRPGPCFFFPLSPLDPLLYTTVSVLLP